MGCLRGCDGYARNVQFMYEGDEDFKTATGGCFAIITQILIFIYGLQQLIYLFIKPDFDEQIESTFVDFNHKHARLAIDTNYTTLAAKLDLWDHDVTAWEVARIGFYRTRRNENDFSFTFLPAARCSDIYAEEIETDEFFRTEFSNPDWICPDLGQINIYNNPFLFDHGQNFIMVVNECPVAVAAELEDGITPYTDI